MELRTGHRRSAHLVVVLRTDDGVAIEGELRDVSASGAYVVSPWPAVLHRNVLLHFKKSAAIPRETTVAAEVVRSDPAGFAVEWRDFSSQPIRTILRQLAHRMA